MIINPYVFAATAASAPSYVDVTTAIQAANTGTHPISYPSSVLENDILIIAFSYGAANTGTFTPPSGFTLIRRINVYDSLAVYYKVADGTETGTVNFTTAINRRSAMIMAQYRGVDVADVVEAKGYTVNSFDYEAVSPTQTTALDDSLVIRVANWSTDTGYTNVTTPDTKVAEASPEVGSSLGTILAMSYDVQATAGASGTGSFFNNGDSVTNNSNTCAMTIVLNPNS